MRGLELTGGDNPSKEEGEAARSLHKYSSEVTKDDNEKLMRRQ
jgi:hypothetical protein